MPDLRVIAVHGLYQLRIGPDPELRHLQLQQRLANLVHCMYHIANLEPKLR